MSRRVYTWADIGTQYDGPHATPTRTNAGPYFLNISSLNNGRLDLNQSDHVSEADFETWTRRVTPQADDLLFSYETRLGEAALMPNGVEACLGRRMALLRPNTHLVVPRYLLYHYLSPAFQRLIDQNAIHGATVDRISLSTMGSWELSLPSLADQQAIGEVLGALDDKIVVNTELAGTAEELGKSLLRDRPSTVALSELVIHRKKSASPASLDAPVVAHFSLPAFDASRQPESVAPDGIKSSKYCVEEPSVLISKLNPRFPRVWNVCRLPEEPALASTEFLVLEPEFSSTSVLWALLAQESFGYALQAKVAGTSGSHQRVRPADLLSTLVIDPRELPRSTMDSIDSLAAAQDSAIAENQRLSLLRDSLLPRLMSGKLRVKDAEKIVEAMV